MKTINKVFYGLGDMGVSITYFSVTFFFLYYLTDILGMSAGLAGIAYFIGKLWDGVNDPLMGWISDRTRSRFGRKRVYMIYGSVPFGLSFLLLWFIPLSVSEFMKFVLVVLALFFFGTMYTVIIVPYFSMVPVLSQDYDERTTITGIRAMLSTLGTIFGGLIALLTSSFSDQLQGLRLTGIIFGGIATLAILIAAYGSRGVEKLEDQYPILQESMWNYVKLAREPTVFRLLSLKFVGAIGTGILSAAIPYYAKYVLEGEEYSTYGLAVYIIFGALSIPVWNKLTMNHDKRDLLLIGNGFVASVLFGIGFFVSRANIMFFFVGTGLLGMSMGAYLFIPYSLVPDLVEYYHVNYGERHESIFFGLWISIHQLGISVAGLILGLLFQFSGYQGNAKVQTSSAMLAIRIGFGVLPGLFLILAALILRPYKITRDVYNNLLEKIVVKHETDH